MPFADYVESVLAQTVKRLVVTRRSIRRAFEDLVITDESFNEIGPAINSAASIFLFGFPGNGKTSVAERITRLMGDNIYIPYAIEVGGSIIKLLDPTVHEIVETEARESGSVLSLLKGASYDQRFVPITFQPSAGGLTVQAPGNANLAPPGNYMLFIVDTNGVPSAAAMVSLG